jgi:hypothetical protein
MLRSNLAFLVIGLVFAGVALVPASVYGPESPPFDLNLIASIGATIAFAIQVMIWIRNFVRGA